MRTKAFKESTLDENAMIPELQEVFDLVKFDPVLGPNGEKLYNSKLCMNIEVKVPDDTEIRGQYRLQKAL